VCSSDLAFYEKNKKKFTVTANYDLLEKVNTIDAISPGKAIGFKIKEEF